jgi:hypothetical protein
MKALLQFAWGVLTFKHEAYTEHVARSDALRRALVLLVIVTLLAGFIPLVIGIVDNWRPMDPRAIEQEMRQGFGEFFGTLGSFMDLPSDFEEGVEQFFEMVGPWIQVGARIDNLRTPLPRPVTVVLNKLGEFLSLPFSRAGGWLGYALWVLLASKLLGGKAKLHQMLGCTALYAVPHVLDILGPITCLGGLAGLVATVWGIAIYVKGVAVASDFGTGKAILATVLPALVVAVLVLVGVLVAGILALVTG